MCIDTLFGSSGGSESGPKWSSGDSDLVNNILLSGILSKLPKNALQPMLNSKDSGLGNFLNRVYGGDSSGTSNTQSNNGQVSRGQSPGSSYGPVYMNKPASNANTNTSSNSGIDALNNLQAFNTGSGNSYTPGSMGYNVLGTRQPFSGYNRINSKYKIF